MSREAVFRTTDAGFDPCETNGPRGGGARFEMGASGYSDGVLTLYIRLGCASMQVYPTADSLRRLAETLADAADMADRFSVGRARP